MHSSPTPDSPSFTCFGLGGSCSESGVGVGRKGTLLTAPSQLTELFDLPCMCFEEDFQMYTAEEISGTWTCVCAPGGWGHYRIIPQGADTINKEGCACLFFFMPIIFSEPWDRFPGQNVWHKRGDEGSKNVFFSKNCICNGLGWECKG